MEFVRANFKENQIREALKLYPFELTNISINKLTGIANDNYRIKSNNIDIALKIYSHGQSDKQKIQLELDAQQLFYKEGIKVPKFLIGKDGVVLQEYNGFYVSATEFIEGAVFDQIKFTDTKMFEVGNLVANVENTSKALDLSSFETLSMLEELNYVLKNLDSSMAEKKYNWDLSQYYQNLQIVKEIATKLDNMPNNQFIHKDIWPWNLIDSKDGIYLLDFNDWAVGPPIIELAVPFLEFSMFKSSELNKQVATKIIEGYKEIKDITYSQNEFWETLLFICYLYFPYNVIQADDPFESEIYLKRINTLLNNRDILKNIF